LGDEVKPEPESTSTQCVPGCFDCASGEVHELGNKVEGEQGCAYVEVEQEARASTEEWGIDLEEVLAKVEIGDDVHKAIRRAVSALG
jgi:hypothetical protein